MFPSETNPHKDVNLQSNHIASSNNLKHVDRQYQDRVSDIYHRCQKLKMQTRTIRPDGANHLASQWQTTSIPALQRRVVDEQLKQLKAGYVPQVFQSFLRCLKEVSLESFSILDAACASGYYSEVLKRAETRDIVYHGSDYSEPMIELASKLHPDSAFTVEDITALSFSAAAFDVVLLAGVLEHVGRYKTAIKEACRVAREYVLIHRLPLTLESKHRHTIGSQYTIKTLRTFFSAQSFVGEMSELGFAPVFSCDVESAKCRSILFKRRSTGNEQNKGLNYQ